MSLEGLLGVLAAVAGWFIGLSALSDNSFFTHLATGRLILDRHRVPTVDPYTFTAPGHAWVVQSWLASLAYGVLDRLGGDDALVLMKAASTAGLAALVWLLARPCRSVLPRLALVVVALGIGKGFWVERPLTFGLLLLGVALLAADGRIGARWMVPVFFVWVNVHGSFPLGLVALVVLVAGAKLDGAATAAPTRVLKLALVGTVLGGINPVGPRVLLFPAELVSKQDVLRHVSEWQAPAFTSIAERLFLVLIVAFVISMVRRPSWQAALTAAVFVPAALLGARNVPVAALVLVPHVARGLSGIGALKGDLRRPVFGVAAAALVAIAVVTGVAYPRTHAAYDLSTYPVAAIDYLDHAGLVGVGQRLVTQDVVGNYLELRYGTAAATFADDRFDMLPADVTQDLVTLMGGRAGWDRILDDREATAVLWDASLPLAQLLEGSRGWRITYRDARWIVAVRR